MKTPLVSIIIPTYNRAHLIGETLDSVLAQTYPNWECIVVDDGSSDNTDLLMASYVAKDARFKYDHRPENHLPGGNGARNFGFKLSKGDYIQWFDSDDLMTSNHLEQKISVFQKSNVDFVVSKTQFLNHATKKSFYLYKFSLKDVTFLNFVTGVVHWLTPDLMVKRSIANSVIFNESMVAGQEYNYGCKLLLETTSCALINEYLTLQRINAESIQGKRNSDSVHHQITIFKVHWLNYQDLKKLHRQNEADMYSLYQCIKAIIATKGVIQIPLGFYWETLKVFKFKSCYFFMAVFFRKFTGKYHRFYKKFQATMQ